MYQIQSGAFILITSCQPGCSSSLLRRIVLTVHRPDDDDLLQAGGGGRRGPQLLHQRVEGVRVDGLLLVGLKAHLLRGVDGDVGGLHLEVLDDGRSRGVGGRCGVGGHGACRCSFGDGRLREGWLSALFAVLGEFALHKRHRMTGGQEDHCSGRET